MKNFTLVFSVIIGLSSCTLNQGGFVKQKYTNLKAIKPTKEAQPLISQVKKVYNEVVNSNDEDKKLDDKQPLYYQVKQAMNRGDLIVVKINNQPYILRDPQYDIVYQTLTGELLATDLESYNNVQRLELFTNEIEDLNNGSKIIYLRNVQKSETFSQEQIDKQIRFEKVEPTVKDFPRETKTNEENREVSTEDRVYHSNRTLKSDPSNKIHQSKNVQTAKKLRIGGLISAKAMVLSLIIFMTTFSTFFIVMALMMYIVTFILMVATIVYYRRYKNECRYAGIKEKQTIGGYKLLTWLGLVLFSIPLLGLPLLIPILAVALQSRRT